MNTEANLGILQNYLSWYARHEPELSTVAALQATYCRMHAEMIGLNGGECPEPLLADVAADFAKLETLLAH